MKLSRKKLRAILPLALAVTALVQSHCFTPSMYRTARVLGETTEGKPEMNYSVGLGPAFSITMGTFILFSIYNKLDGKNLVANYDTMQSLHLFINFDIGDSLGFVPEVSVSIPFSKTGTAASPTFFFGLSIRFGDRA